jgi:putative transposase
MRMSHANRAERRSMLSFCHAIRRGSFTSVKQLVQRIDHFVAAHNTNCQLSVSLQCVTFALS